MDNIKEVKEGMVYEKMQWSTVIDLQNKLITHVMINITEVKVDDEVVDPDGIPLVWVEGKYVTRVRRMTNEEFEKYVKEFEIKIDICECLVEIKV